MPGCAVVWLAPVPRKRAGRSAVTASSGASACSASSSAGCRFAAAVPDVVTTGVTRPDTFAASTTYLKTNDRVRLSDMLHLLLLPSDNAAARVLARVSPLGYDGFIARMNQKAKDLGLDHTHYADSSGLNAGNVSSAYDMARLISYAAEDDRIGPIMRTPEYSFRTTAGRLITVRSTNQILRAGDVDVLGGKTGFIAKAGYCLATLLKLPQGGPSLAVVVLGANSNPGRFWETRHLLAWLSERAALYGLVTPAVVAPAK